MKHSSQQIRQRLQRRNRTTQQSSVVFPMDESMVPQFSVVIDDPTDCQSLFGAVLPIEFVDTDGGTGWLTFTAQLDVRCRTLSVDTQTRKLSFSVDISIFTNTFLQPQLDLSSGSPDVIHVGAQNQFALSAAFEEAFFHVANVRLQLLPILAAAPLRRPPHLLKPLPVFEHARQYFLKWVAACQGLLQLSSSEVMLAAISQVFEAPDEAAGLERLLRMLRYAQQLSSNADTAICFLDETGCLPESESTKRRTQPQTRSRF